MCIDCAAVVFVFLWVYLYLLIYVMYLFYFKVYFVKSICIFFTATNINYSPQPGIYIIYLLYIVFK
jgi:hypothetical protein